MRGRATFRELLIDRLFGAKGPGRQPTTRSDRSREMLAALESSPIGSVRTKPLLVFEPLLPAILCPLGLYLGVVGLAVRPLQRPFRYLVGTIGCRSQRSGVNSLTEAADIPHVFCLFELGRACGRQRYLPKFPSKRHGNAR